MLTPKERVYRAVAHEETDVVPYNIPINSRAHKRLAEVYGEGFDRDIVNHIVGVPVDIRTFPPDDVVGDWEDEFGCVWRQSRDGAPHIVKHALSKPSLKGYEFPDFSGAERYGEVPKAIEAHRDRFTVLGLGVAFFERSWALRGFEQIMVDFHRHPDFVEELLDRLMELHSRTIDRFVKYNIDAVQFGDDFGMQKGLLMGPRIWRKFLKPRLRQIYGRAKEAGKLVMIHSCGDNSEIMGDLIEIGVNIFNPTQPEAMDIFELKRMWGSQITFNGGVTTQRLAFYTPEQIREEVRRVRGFMAKGGGFVLETTKPIRWDVPPETAMALIEEVTKPSQ